MLALLLFAHPSTANAEPIPANAVGASFDLSEGAAQEREVILNDGRIATIGIEKVGGADESEVVPYWESSYANATGEWRIYCNNPLIYREYYIYISSNHVITRAWGAYYQSLLCAVTGENLSRTSKKASYRLNWVAMADSASGVALLDATIDGTKLRVSGN